MVYGLAEKLEVLADNLEGLLGGVLDGENDGVPVGRLVSDRVEVGTGGDREKAMVKESIHPSVDDAFLYQLTKALKLNKSRWA